MLSWKMETETEVVVQTKDEIIDFDFIMRDDLRDFIFKEDSNEVRYRERIWDKIREFGVEKWFIAKGFPTDESSVWKNRYTEHLTTLKDEIHHFDNGFLTFNLETNGYLLWENWLPIEIWNNKDVFVKKGTLARWF